MPSMIGTNTYDFASLKNQCREIIEKELGEPESRTESYSKFRCPLHAEKTASFVVYEDHYNCYGCGSNGDAVDFLQRRHHMTTKQVMEYLGLAKGDNSQAVEAYRKQRETEKATRKAELDQKRHEFSQGDLWETYHRNLDDRTRWEWRTVGIPDYWQDMWRLGYTKNKCYEHNNELYHSPALTIPYSTFVNGKPPEYYTVQYRLLNPVNPKDKYRFENGLGSGLWVARPDLHPGEKLTRVLLAEGMKKAAVAYIVLAGAMQVLGAPSKNGLSAYVDVLKQFEEVYVWMDPDITNRPEKAKNDWRPNDELLCSLLPQARYIRYPKKLDDTVLEYGLTNENLLDIMRYSSRR